MDFRRRRPSEQTLRWVGDELGAAPITRWRRLTGGLGSAVHRLSVEASDVGPSVVLRQYEDVADERWVRREAEVLDGLRRTDIPAPTLFATDPDGDATGHPTVLMSRVPGRIELAPADPDRWIGQMATAAAAIHEQSLNMPTFGPWKDPEDLTAPTDTTRPDLWRRVHDLVRAPGPNVPHTFIHRDFQHFNLLWARGRLTGVVDWTFSATGPREVDVGHCCLNLAVLHSAERSIRFLDRYEAEAGVTLDRWWLASAVATYSDYWPRTIPIQVDGRCPVDVAGMTERVEALIRSVLDS